MAVAAATTTAARATDLVRLIVRAATLLLVGRMMAAPMLLLRAVMLHAPSPQRRLPRPLTLMSFAGTDVGTADPAGPTLCAGVPSKGGPTGEMCLPAIADRQVRRVRRPPFVLGIRAS